MGNVITRKELEALEEKLPLPDGRLLCSQSESESAIEALMREASRHVSSSPNAESTDWAHVATITCHICSDMTSHIGIVLR